MINNISSPRKLSLILIILLNISDSFAAKNRNSSLRSFGDYMQIINPILASGLASQEKGFGHFAIIYGQTFVIMHSMKLVAKSGKWEISKRPHVDGKKDRYEGFPSGHTASAWVAASYIRNFSEEYKLLSIPLYITAAITGYSRIKSKEHTVTQVVAGAILAESITFVNSKLKWSNEYNSTNFSIGKNGGMISFQFKL